MNPIVRIYAMTHKEFQAPADATYLPMFVGARNHSDCPYLPDAGVEADESIYPELSAPDISKYNPFYCELTGMYRVYRTDHDADILGLCHYRRYLQNAASKIFTASQIQDILSHYDVMTTKKVILDHSYLDGFSGKHNREDLLTAGRVIAEMYPTYEAEFNRVIHQNTTYFGNMLIARREIFCNYSNWLFSILFQVHKRIDMSGYNDYQKRVFGFISEVLLMVYINVNDLSVFECDVAVFGEKKETNETKQRLADYFQRQDLEGAKQYFMDVYQKRPDILMEASDTKGELKLCTQMLATFSAQTELLGRNYLSVEHRLPILLEEFERMNRILREHNGNVNIDQNELASNVDLQWLWRNEYSEITIQMALKILYPKAEK